MAYVNLVLSCLESSLILPAEDTLSRLAPPAGVVAGLDMASSFVFLIKPFAVRFLPITGDFDDLELGDDVGLSFLRGTSSAGVKGRVGETRLSCVS